MDSKPSSKSRTIMLIATLAAVYAVLRIIPTFPVVGVPGVRFSASDSVASLYGMILRPYASALCIVMGTFIGYFIGRPLLFYGLDFMPAAVNGVIVGLILRGQRRYALLAYVLLIFLFLAHPYVQILIPVASFLGGETFPVPFVWLHLVGVLILGSPFGSKLTRLMTKSSVTLIAVGFSITSLVGTLCQHLTGNLLYASLILPLSTEQARLANWTVIFWLYPFERIIIVALSTVIGVPMIRALRTLGSTSLRVPTEIGVTD